MDASTDFRRLRGAEAAPTEWLGEREQSEEQRLVERVGTRTFYRVSDRWVDASYDKTGVTRKVQLFSEEYFQLIRKHPELAGCFALGERVVVVLGETVYETVPPPTEDG